MVRHSGYPNIYKQGGKYGELGKTRSDCLFEALIRTGLGGGSICKLCLVSFGASLELSCILCIIYSNVIQADVSNSLLKVD